MALPIHQIPQTSSSFPESRHRTAHATTDEPTIPAVLAVQAVKTATPDRLYRSTPVARRSNGSCFALASGHPPGLEM
ncbi:MAG: hypothetical protein M1399_04570 [Actinobacteria bacterium]|nr:hypothetical protein [Actinomycetota bacterium]